MSSPALATRHWAGLPETVDPLQLIPEYSSRVFSIRLISRPHTCTYHLPIFTNLRD